MDDAIFKALSEGSAILVVLCLFVWMILHQPKKIAEAVKAANKEQAEALRVMAKSNSAVVDALKNIVERALSNQRRTDDALVQLSTEIRQLTITVANQSLLFAKLHRGSNQEIEDLQVKKDELVT